MWFWAGVQFTSTFGCYSSKCSFTPNCQLLLIYKQKRIPHTGLMRIVRLVLAVVLFVAFVLAVPARANTTYMTVAVDPSGRYLNPLTFLENGVVTNGYAGVIQTTFAGGATFDALCLDVFTNINPNTTYVVNTLTPNSPTAQSFSANVGRAAWLYVTEMPLVNASANKSAQAAALQLAIWDVMTDNGDGLSAGRIQGATGQNAATQAIYSQASAWIAASAGQGSNVAAVLINIGGPTVSQTLITSSGALSAGSTPEPGSLALMGSGLAAFGMLFRKRAKSPRTAVILQF
jgi:hypothetical protein